MKPKLDFGNIALSGDTVVLEPLQLEHGDALFQASSEDRKNYLFNRVPEGINATRSYIERALAQRLNGDRFPFVIIWNDRIVGTTSFSGYQPWTWPAQCSNQREVKPDVIEIGYTWLAHSAQRTRCNSETKFLLLCHAFDELAVHRVSFRTDARNIRSRNAIERLGASFEGIRRGDQPGVDCTVRDSAFYSIIASEWPSLKEALISKLSN